MKYGKLGPYHGHNQRKALLKRQAPIKPVAPKQLVTPRPRQYDNSRRVIDLGDGRTADLWRGAACIRFRDNAVVLSASQIKKLCCAIHEGEDKEKGRAGA